MFAIVPEVVKVEKVEESPHFQTPNRNLLFINDDQIEGEVTPQLVLTENCKMQASMSSIKVLEQKDYMNLMQKDDQTKSEDKEKSGDVKMTSSFEDQSKKSEPCNKIELILEKQKTTKSKRERKKPAPKEKKKKDKSVIDQIDEVLLENKEEEKPKVQANAVRDQICKDDNIQKDEMM